jgi:hypothetical protein
MLHVVVAALLTAGTTIHLAATPMDVVDVPTDRGRFLSQHLAQQLSLKPRLTVTTPEDIARILGLERQRQLMGCSQNECVTELAGALGVDGIITSSLAKVGQGYVLNVRVIGARKGELLSAYSGRANGEDDVIALLETAANTVAEALAPAPPPSPKRWALVPGIVGAALAVGGGVSFGISVGDRKLIEGRTAATQADLTAAASQGKVTQMLGVVGLISGGALLVGSLLIALLVPDAPTVSLAVTNQGGLLALSWRFR